MSRIPKRLWSSALLVALGFLCAPVRSQDGPAEHEYRVKFDIGYRWKSLRGSEGSEDLYRTQLDLGEGPKVFSGELFFAPADGANALLDRLQINVSNWGGEPYNTARIQMAKNRAYELDFVYQNAAYFSAIPSFANPLVEGVGFPVTSLPDERLRSQHREDTSLRTTGLELRLWPGGSWTPYLGYQRTTRFGPVLTTLPADGDEFPLGKNLDFSSDDLRGGIVFLSSRLSFRVEQGARWFRDRSELFSPGFQGGNSSAPFLGRDMVLDRYQSWQDVKSGAMPHSSAWASFRPVDQLLLQGRVSYSMADLRTRFQESLAGSFFSLFDVRGFYSRAETDVSGTVKRPDLYADFSAQWRPLRRLQVVERVEIRRAHVSGSRFLRQSLFDLELRPSGRFLDRLDTESLLDAFIGWDTDRVQSEAQIFVTPELTLRAGHRYETRKLELDAAALTSPGFEPPSEGLNAFDWTRNVLILGGTYRLSGRNRISVEYELGRTDQPIMRTDPADFDRLRIQGRLSPFERLEFNGSASLFDHEESSLDFTSRSRVYSLQFTYRPLNRLAVAGHWERSDFHTRIPYLIPQILAWDTFTFDELGDYGSLYVDAQLMRNSRLSLGYSVWGNRGDFPVNHHQPFARLEIPLTERVAVYGQWNHYDYNENIDFFAQRYRAHLAVFGFRYSMGN
jgi:hypothetical protein